MNKTNQNLINSEDEIFEITSSVFIQEDVNLDEMRRRVRVRCSDDRYYKLFDHLINYYFEKEYREYEIYLGYTAYNNHEKKLQITASEDEDKSFYSFSLNDFCKRLKLNLQEYEYCLGHIGISSARHEFFEKLVKFKVQTFINSFDIVVSEQIMKVFLMVAVSYAKQKAKDFNEQYFPEKKTKPESESFHPIKVISIPMGGQNGKKHH